jgi:KTSC domain
LAHNFLESFFQVAQGLQAMTSFSSIRFYTKELQEPTFCLLVAGKGTAAMPSSVIRRYRYDEMQRTLEITFVSGKVYVYADVPPDVFEDFCAAPSKGQFFNRHIRDCYAYADVVSSE